MNLKALHCKKYNFENDMGIPWQKLRSYKPCCMATKKENDRENVYYNFEVSKLSWFMMLLVFGASLVAQW